MHGIACKQERQYASGTKCSRRCMAAYSHTRPLRNSRIKKLRHGIFDFGLRNYGIRSWGGARKRFQVPNPHDSRLLCVRPPVPCDLPPAPRPTSRTQGSCPIEKCRCWCDNALCTCMAPYQFIEQRARGAGAVSRVSIHAAYRRFHAACACGRRPRRLKKLRRSGCGRLENP